MSLVTVTWQRIGSGRARWASAGVHRQDLARWRVQLRLTPGGKVEIRATRLAARGALHLTVSADLVDGRWRCSAATWMKPPVQIAWTNRLVRIANLVKPAAVGVEEVDLETAATA